MNKSLGVFMIIAITAVIMGSLVFGVVYDSLNNKNFEHQNVMENEHQLIKK